MENETKVIQEPADTPIADWFNEGQRIFGSDVMKWKFVCSNCGNVQSLEDFIELGISKEDAQSYVFFSCIGRVMKGTKGELGNKIKPCNYTLGGLITLKHRKIIKDDGKPFKAFDFYRAG